MRTILLAILLLSSHAFAGWETGNGGDIVVCGVDVYVLDFHPTNAVFGPLDLGDPKLTPQEKVSLVIERMKPFDPIRAKKLKRWLASFEREALRRYEVDLPEIDDTKRRHLPDGCRVHQAVIQLPSWRRKKGDPVYLIDQRRYESLDHDNRAGLILHELIYREAILYGHVDSLRVATFTAWLSSTVMRTMTQKHYDSILYTVDLPRYR